MIKGNQEMLNRLNVLIDAVLIGVSFLLSYLIKFYIFEPEPGPGVLPIQSYYTLLPFLVPGFVLVYFFTDVYTPRRSGSRHSEILDLVRANTVGIAMLVLIVFGFLKMVNYARSVFALFYFLNILLGSVFRIVLRSALRAMRRKGYNLKHVLLVGYSRAGEEYMDRIRENPQWGYDVMGVLDNHVPAGASYYGVKVIGRLGHLEVLLQENELDEVAVTLPLSDYDRLTEMVSICEKFGVHTKFVPDYNSVIPTRPYTEDIGGLPVINIRYVPLNNSGNRMIKRVFDIVVSALGLLLTSPILLICAAAVRCSGSGPIIFKQERVGLHNKSFWMYKFRSMEVQEASDERSGWTVPDDPRVTKAGRFLRRTSLDELPQLVNILKGDMSLVGPRPERPQFVEKFQEEIPRYMVKHQVRPGLTGWAQVNGLRGDTSIRKRIEYDIYYIENWTFFFDIRIILMTFFTGFVNKNAY